MNAQDVTNGKKLCSKCGEQKSLSSFGKHKMTRSGYRSNCKTCLKNSSARRCIDCGAKVWPGSERCQTCRVNFARGENHWRWNGGKTVDKDGYVLVSGLPDHPNATSWGQVREHVLVMTEILGRGLLSHEEVHHKNGVRDDNRPENLELWSKSQPSGQRVEDKVRWAQEILELYGPLVWPITEEKE